MQASQLDFTQVQYFQADDFPRIDTAVGRTSVLHFVEAGLIRALDRFRGRLGADLVPSPKASGWIREGGSHANLHYIGPIQLDEDGTPQSARLSVAADVFPLCDIRHALLVALAMPEFGGIGVYLDVPYAGRPTPMLHLDLRLATRRVWLRDRSGYQVPARGDADLRRFFQRLAAW